MATSGEEKPIKKEVRRPLKPRDYKFIAAKVKNPDMPDYKAVQLATGAKDQNVASTQAARMLQNVTLREKLDETMTRLGFNMDIIMAPVQDALSYQGETDRETMDVRLKGHDRAMKALQIIDGPNQQQNGPTINFNFGATKYRKD